MRRTGPIRALTAILLTLHLLQMRAQPLLLPDTLLERLAQIPTDTGRARHMLQYSFVYAYKQPRWSEALAREGLRLNRKQGFTPGEIHALNMTGLALRRRGSYDSAFHYLMEGLRLSEQIGDLQRVAVTLNNLGLVFWNLESYREAQPYFLRAASIQRQLGNRAAEANAMANLGIVQTGLGNHDSALYYYRQVLEVYESLDHQLGIATTLHNIGIEYRELGQLDQSNAYLRQSRERYARLGNLLMQSNASKNLAINLIRQRQLDSAYASAQLALRLAETQGALKELIDSYGVLSDYYEAAGDYAQSRKLLLLQRDLRDSQFNLEKTRQIAELKTQYETEHQVAELRRQADAERESRIRLSLLAGAACIALVLMGYVFYLRHQEARARLLRSEAERQRLETEEEAQRLRAEHLESELAYRNRELAAKALHLVRKNEVLAEVSSQLGNLPDSGGVHAVQQAIRSHISSDQDWEDFKAHFEAVHTGFFERLKAHQPRLTPYDLRFCAYLRMNLSTKEIAILLNASVRGMETQRYRLRKKLGLQSHEDLVEWIMQA